jgi:hypothetical protein
VYRNLGERYQACCLGRLNLPGAPSRTTQWAVDRPEGGSLLLLLFLLFRSIPLDRYEGTVVASRRALRDR